MPPRSIVVRRLLVVLVLCLAPLLTASPAAAAADDLDNAATWYRRAAAAVTDLPRQPRAVLADWDRRTIPSRAVRRAIRDHREVLDLAARGASCRDCDFDIAYDEGFALTVPHLSGLRELQRVLAARAAVAIHDGRPAAATADIERIQRIAGHTAQDSILISSLVAMAGVRLADELVGMGFGRGVFGAAEAADLLGGTRDLSAAGAFGLRRAVAMEREINSVWLRDQLVNASPEERASLLGLTTGAGADDEEIGGRASLSNEELESELDLLDASFAAIDESFALMEEDPEAAIASLEDWREELEAGVFGELSTLFVPAFGRVLGQGIELRAELLEREAMLRDVMRGDGKGAGLDGAVHLREAIARAATIPDEAAELIALGGGILEGVADAAATTAAWDVALEQLAAAAAAEAFDPNILVVEGDSTILPPWLGGARRTLGMLAGTASERLDAGEPAEAARLAVIGMRLARRMADAHVILASMVAGEHLTQLTPVVRALPESVRADTTLWTAVEAAADGLAMEPIPTMSGESIPERLGFSAATRRMAFRGRQAVIDLRARVDAAAEEAGEAGEAEDEDGLDEILRLDADQLVTLLLVTERVAGTGFGPLAPPADAAPRPEDDPDAAPPAPEAAATDRLPRVAGLTGMVDEAALDALELRIVEMRRDLALRDRTVAEILGTEPSPLDVRPHARRAGQVVRDLRGAITVERSGTVPPDAGAAGGAA
jgi:hypothetical protein